MRRLEVGAVAVRNLDGRGGHEEQGQGEQRSHVRLRQKARVKVASPRIPRASKAPAADARDQVYVDASGARASLGWTRPSASSTVASRPAPNLEFLERSR